MTSKEQHARLMAFLGLMYSLRDGYDSAKDYAAALLDVAKALDLTEPVGNR